MENANCSGELGSDVELATPGARMTPVGISVFESSLWAVGEIAWLESRGRLRSRMAPERGRY